MPPLWGNGGKIRLAGRCTPAPAVHGRLACRYKLATNLPPSALTWRRAAAQAAETLYLDLQGHAENDILVVGAAHAEGAPAHLRKAAARIKRQRIVVFRVHTQQHPSRPTSASACSSPFTQGRMVIAVSVCVFMSLAIVCSA